MKLKDKLASVDDAVAKIKAATGGQDHGFAGDLGTAAAAEEVVRRHPTRLRRRQERRSASLT